MTEIHALLFLIFLTNVLCVPQVQKVISWTWDRVYPYMKRAKRFTKRWARRGFYLMKDIKK